MIRELLTGKVAIDFVLGGAVVAVAVAASATVGPVFGGLIAGLPIRVGSAIALGGMNQGTDAAIGMVEGALLTYPSILVFLLSLYFLLPKMDLTRSFAVAGVLCLVSVAIIFKVAGKI